MSTKRSSRVLALYAWAARDFVEFLDACEEEKDEVLQELLTLLQHSPTKNTDAELNKIAADSVSGILKKRNGTQVDPRSPEKDWTWKTQ